MPGLYDRITPEALIAGPRRVTADGVVHERPPPHVPRLPTDEPEEFDVSTLPAAWWPRVD